MQIPADAAGNPALESQWVDSVRPRYGGWTDVFNALGLFNVFNSILFRILAAALTISLIACSIQRIPGMIRTAQQPPPRRRRRRSSSTRRSTRQIVVRRGAAETRELVEGVLARPPLPDARRGRRHGPPLRRPVPLGPVRGPDRPPLDRADHRGRHPRRGRRLPEPRVHDRGGPDARRRGPARAWRSSCVDFTDR